MSSSSAAAPGSSEGAANGSLGDVGTMPSTFDMAGFSRPTKGPLDPCYANYLDYPAFAQRTASRMGAIQDENGDAGQQLAGVLMPSSEAARTLMSQIRARSTACPATPGKTSGTTIKVAPYAATGTWDEVVAVVTEDLQNGTALENGHGSIRIIARKGTWIVGEVLWQDEANFVTQGVTIDPAGNPATDVTNRLAALP